MIREELVFVATCDISGLVRGKGFPARELPARLKKGVGWTGSNLMMSPQGPIWDTPFGTAGDPPQQKPAHRRWMPQRQQQSEPTARRAAADKGRQRTEPRQQLAQVLGPYLVLGFAGERHA